MRTFAIMVVLSLAGLLDLSAQSTMQFTVSLNGGNEVPPTDSTRIGSGSLSLNGVSLDYAVAFSATVDVPTDVTINGPASTTAAAPILFDLGAPFTIVPNPPQLPWAVTGTIDNLTSTQVSELLSGLWYVNVISSSASYPSGEIRGQITPVPEPSTGALVVGSLALLCLGKPLRRMNWPNQALHANRLPPMRFDSCPEP